MADVAQVQKMHDTQEVAAPELRSAKRRKTSPEVPAAKKKPAIATSTWYASASHRLMLRSHCYTLFSSSVFYTHTDKRQVTCKTSVTDTQTISVTSQCWGMTQVCSTNRYTIQVGARFGFCLKSFQSCTAERQKVSSWCAGKHGRDLAVTCQPLRRQA